MILKLEQAQRRIFINTFMLKINITFNLSLACLQNEDHGQKRILRYYVAWSYLLEVLDVGKNEKYDE